jgi:plastocyanin
MTVSNMKRIFIVLLILSIALSQGCTKQGETSIPAVAPTTTSPTANPPVITATPSPPLTEAPAPEEIRTAHFIDSVPSHGEVFVTVPEKVLINFDDTLGALLEDAPGDTSKMTVYHEGQEGTRIASTETRIEIRMINGSVLKTVLDPKYGDGKYIVEYRACRTGGTEGTGGTCNDGRYGFSVDSLTIENYANMTKKAYVEIKMAGNRFNPQNVIISRGTRVTWTNEEGTVHTVATDPFKSENYVLPLKSNVLSKYNSYEYTFVKTGEFPYHCRLHYPDGMVGRILVK